MKKFNFDLEDITDNRDKKEFDILEAQRIASLLLDLLESKKTLAWLDTENDFEKFLRLIMNGINLFPSSTRKIERTHQLFVKNENPDPNSVMATLKKRLLENALIYSPQTDDSTEETIQ